MSKVHRAIRWLRRERILGVPFTGQKGQAMIIVLGVLMLLALVPLIVFTEASQHLPVSVNKQDAQAALAAAQAGVADFMTNYTHPPSGLSQPYLAYSTPTCTPNPPAPLYYPPGACPNLNGGAGQPQGAWTPVPNSGAPLNEETTYTIHLSQASGSVTLVSSGEAGTAPTKIVRTVTVTMTQNSLLSYAYFTNTNAADPQRYNCSPNLLSTANYNFNLPGGPIGQYLDGLLGSLLTQVLSAIASALPYVLNGLWGYLYSQFYVDLGGCVPQLFNGSINLGLPAIAGGANQASFDLAQFRCDYTAYQSNILDGSAPLGGRDAQIEGTTMDSILDWISGLVTGGGEGTAGDTGDIDGDGGYSGSGYGPDNDDCQVNTFSNVANVHGYTMNPASIHGPIGSNDALYICGNTTFNNVVRLGVPLGGTAQAPNGYIPWTSTGGQVTVLGQTFQIPHLCPNGSTNAVPTFTKGQPILQSPLPFPSTMAPVVNAAPTSGNCEYTGPTIFQLNGTTMTVTPLDPNNNSQPGCVGTNVPLPPNGLIYVQNDPNVVPSPAAQYPPQPSSVTTNGYGTGPPGTDLPYGNQWQNNSLGSDQCTVNGYTWSNPVQNSVQSEFGASTTGDTCAAGDAIVLPGTLWDGYKLTIAAANNVVVTGNILYTGSNANGSTCTHAPGTPVPGSCQADLGLLGRNYVLIDHPVNPVTYQLPPFVNQWLSCVANPGACLINALFSTIQNWINSIDGGWPWWAQDIVGWVIGAIQGILNGLITGILSWWTSTVGLVVTVIQYVISFMPYVTGNTNATNTRTVDDEFADGGLDEAGFLNNSDYQWENPGNWTQENDNDNPISGEGGNADAGAGGILSEETWTFTATAIDQEYLGGENLVCWSWWFSSGCVPNPADAYVQDPVFSITCFGGNVVSFCMPFVVGSGEGNNTWLNTSMTNPFEWIQDAAYGVWDLTLDFADKIQDGGDGILDWAAPETPLAPFCAPNGPGNVTQPSGCNGQGLFNGYQGSSGQITNLDAVILAVHHGFMLQNYGAGTGRLLNDCSSGAANLLSQWFSTDSVQTGWSGRLGNLTVNGAVIQNYAEPMGERQPAWTWPIDCPSGFNTLSYNYDPLLLFESPPMFNQLLGGGTTSPINVSASTETAPAVKPN